MLTRSIPILILVAFLNALCFPLVTLGLEHAPHITFATLRAMIAGLSLAIIAAILRRPIPTDVGSWIALCAIGLGATTLAYFGMFRAAEFVSPGLATILTNTQPLIAAVLAFGVLSERLRPAQYMGLGIGFLGIITIAMPQLGFGDGFGEVAALSYALLAAAGLAVSNVVMKTIRGSIDPLVAMAAQLLLGALPLAILALLTEQPSEIHLSPGFALTLVLLALPGTALSYWLWFWVLERIPLSYANAFTFLTPVLALLIGVIAFDEQIGPLLVSGLILTCIGVVIVQRNSRGQIAPTA
ncbi:DMT family transporter [Terrihabitans sp. B22-R8]|uniref:DMT family transporter n=1 Tax=Terrihabitans sp. B22-R8 TaxID=3425128 RepID=UPI00403CE685